MACQLAKNRGNRGTHQVSPSVATVGSDDIVVRSQGSLHSDSASLLAGIQVAESTNLLLLVHRTRSGFETSNWQHLTVHEQRLILVDGDWCVWTLGKLVQLELLQIKSKVGNFHELTITLGLPWCQSELPTSTVAFCWRKKWLSGNCAKVYNA